MVNSHQKSLNSVTGTRTHILTVRKSAPLPARPSNMPSNGTFLTIFNHCDEGSSKALKARDVSLYLEIKSSPFFCCKKTATWFVLCIWRPNLLGCMWCCMVPEQNCVLCLNESYILYVIPKILCALTYALIDVTASTAMASGHRTRLMTLKIVSKQVRWISLLRKRL